MIRPLIFTGRNIEILDQNRLPEEIIYVTCQTAEETAEAISSRLGTHGVETTSLNYSMSFLNNNGSKGTSLISRRLLTADEIKQLHYKTIIFPTVGYPIFRDTVVYQKFSCYKKDKKN